MNKPPDFGDYRFTPRPEARWMRWSELAAPTRRTTCELLEKLSASMDVLARAKDSYHPATSLLVSGRRGSGKTTVLLSAAHATGADHATDPGDRLEEFFGGPHGAPEHERARGAAERLQNHVVWLPLLDMEPLPPRANLLATLLVRVRDQLDAASGGQDGGRRPSASVLEDGANDSWTQIDRLVHDATLMWEDPQGPDARARAEEQVRAAEIYTQFNGRFEDAMSKVARALARRRFSRDDDQVVLVQCIDNVDRSIDHLQRIVKLIRMVSSKHLWFVLAAGRGDFQFFLERTYLADLQPGGEVADETRADELRGIARRQAAAAQRKALPPAHWIRLAPLSALEAFQFKPEHTGAAKEVVDPLLESMRGKVPAEALDALKRRLEDPPERVEDIAALLGRIAIDDIPGEPHSLRDLFDVQALLPREVQTAARSLEKTAHTGAETPIFTRAGQLALASPARNVLDLYQALHHEAWTGEAGPERQIEAAIRIAKDMLLSTVNESEMPAWASDLFFYNLVDEDEEGLPVLRLGGFDAAADPRAMKREDDRHQGKGKGLPLIDVSWRPDLRPIWGVPPFPCCEAKLAGPSSELFCLESSLSIAKFPDFEVRMSSDEYFDCDVLPQVWGWLMIFHDLLKLARLRPRVFGNMIPRLELVRSTCTLGRRRGGDPARTRIDFVWPAPLWKRFLDVDFFTRSWSAVTGVALEVFHEPAGGEASLYRRFLLAGWIGCVCDGLNRFYAEKKVDRTASGALFHRDGAPGALAAPLGAHIDAYEEEVYARAVEAHEALKQPAPITSYTHTRMCAEAVRWLERDLPILLLFEAEPGTRLGRIIDETNDDALHRVWKENERWLRAELHRAERFTHASSDHLEAAPLFERGFLWPEARGAEDER